MDGRLKQDSSVFWHQIYLLYMKELFTVSEGQLEDEGFVVSVGLNETQSEFWSGRLNAN